MSVKLDSVSARARLKCRRDPYWQNLSKGHALGFRKMTPASSGTWSARIRDAATSKHSHKSIGPFDDVPPNERFDLAVAAARAWFAHVDRGGDKADSTTVRQACERYVKQLLADKRGTSSDKAEAQFNLTVYVDTLAGIPLSKLKPVHVKDFRARIAGQKVESSGKEATRAKATVNRLLVPLRAALNLAHSDGLVTSTFAWATALAPAKDADNRRELYLDRNQRRALIDAAEADVALFLRALSILPLRPGALAQLTVSGFDKRLSLLTIGKDKAGAGRRIHVPAQTAKFLSECSADKLPTAPLFARSNGKPWDAPAWVRAIKLAVIASGLPAETCAYSLRHSTITDLVSSGLDLATVAQVAGTSIEMIQKHYHSVRPEVSGKALAALAL